MTKFKPADILLVNSGTSYCDIILAALNLFQKDEVDFGHAILIIDDNTAIEAASKISYLDPRKKILEVKSYKILRNNKLTDKQRVNIVKRAEKLFGLKYGTIRILLQLLDQIFNTNFFTSLSKNKKMQICSTLISWSYYVTSKITFNGVGWQSVEPDDICDESEKNTDIWEIICEK